ncbi:MAG: hypothetical protein ABSH22_18685, partial [Tepidisphaeraceae bacterium]
SMAVAGVANPPLHFFCLTAVNKGQRPVTISQAGIVLGDGRTFVPARSALGLWKLPIKLQETDKIDIFANASDIYSALNEARAQGRTSSLSFAYVKDTVGKVYQSAPLTDFTIEDFLPAR